MTSFCSSSCTFLVSYNSRTVPSAKQTQVTYLLNDIVAQCILWWVRQRLVPHETHHLKWEKRQAFWILVSTTERVPNGTHSRSPKGKHVEAGLLFIPIPQIRPGKTMTCWGDNIVSYGVARRWQNALMSLRVTRKQKMFLKIFRNNFCVQETEVVPAQILRA